MFSGNSEIFTVQVKSTKLPTGARTLTGVGPWITASVPESSNEMTRTTRDINTVFGESSIRLAQACD